MNDEEALTCAQIADTIEALFTDYPEVLDTTSFSLPVRDYIYTGEDIVLAEMGAGI